jgi:hypothetical protein
MGIANRMLDDRREFGTLVNRKRGGSSLDPGTYLLPATRSTKRLGLRGDIVAMLDSPEDTLRLAGMDGGDTAIPLEEIESVLIGIVFNRVKDHRTIVRCNGHRPIRISGRFPNYYSNFVPDLASEMERVGQLDRVRLGVPFLLSWGPFYVLFGISLILGGAYQAIHPVNEIDPQGNMLFSAAIAGAGLIFAAFGLHHYLRWERPRPVASLDEIGAYLPVR